jgi:hypothetical protein
LTGGLLLVGIVMALVRFAPNLDPLMKGGAVRGGPGTTLTSSWTRDGREQSVVVQGPAIIVERGPDEAPVIFRE